MSQEVRMADIADKLGVSTVAVSKALSGKAGVGEELRKRIETAAREMGYKRLRSKPRQRTGNIGFLLKNGGDKRGLELYGKASERLAEAGYYCLLEMSDGYTLPRAAADKKVDGVITSGEFADSFLDSVIKNGIPVVALNSYCMSTNASVVMSGVYYGMYTMTRYLIDIGHKRICFVGDPGEQGLRADMFYGYLRAMAQSELSVSADMLLQKAKQEYLPGIMPTAFACADDDLAREMVLLLNQNGYKVPQDISVTGFGDYYGAKSGIPLTTYGFGENEPIAAAADCLLGLIENNDNTQRVIIVPGNLMKRETAAPLMQATL